MKLRILIACSLLAIPARAETVTVQSGDTLSELALQFLGQEAEWPVLCNANTSVLGNNCDLLPVGSVLTIPKINEPVVAPLASPALPSNAGPIAEIAPAKTPAAPAAVTDLPSEGVELDRTNSKRDGADIYELTLIDGPGDHRARWRIDTSSGSEVHLRWSTQSSMKNATVVLFGRKTGELGRLQLSADARGQLVVESTGGVANLIHQPVQDDWTTVEFTLPIAVGDDAVSFLLYPLGINSTAVELSGSFQVVAPIASLR